MTYDHLRLLHMSCAAASLALFVLRGIWMMRASPLLERRWVRITPHVVDTTLLASAIALATIVHQYPLVHGWLTAKFFALLAYIVLGTIALKRGRNRRTRIVAFFSALLVFGYIVATARAHHPMPWLGH